MTSPQIKIVKQNDKVFLISPYHPDLLKRARRLGGSWTNKFWQFDHRDEERVRELCLEIFGTDGSPTPLVTVRCTALTSRFEHTGAIYLCGREIARATGRDSGAKLGQGIVLLEGHCSSGGSVKNWGTKMTEGTVFEIRDVPKRIVERELLNTEENEWVEISIIDTTINVEQLKAEKDRLLQRLEEIETTLKTAQSPENM
jgi:hypothetical protein